MNSLKKKKKKKNIYVHLFFGIKMSHIHQLLLLLFLQIIFIRSYNISSCIPNTRCQCYRTQYSLTLLNCSHTATDLPIFNSKKTNNITKIIARNAFNQWPIQLCKYPNLQILDLSGSYLNSQSVDFSCLNHLIHLNLSNTQLNRIPNFLRNRLNHLQILDLSNNHIKIIDGLYFHSFNHLISLLLQNNPIQSIDHLEYLLNLTNLESINILSSDIGVTLKQSFTLNQWIVLANQWMKSPKSFLLRMNHIPFQSIIPTTDQFESISTNSAKIIFKTFINSTFITLFNTPKCNCIHLRNYQRLFSLIDSPKKYSSPLFQSVKCLMSDGITHARLFDRRTTIDLRCTLLGRISFFPSLSSSASIINYTFSSLICILITLNKK